MSKRGFEEENTAVADGVRQLALGVPAELDLQVSEFRGVVSQLRRCVFCQEMFSKRDVGMLSCLFHPSEYFNRGVKHGLGTQSHTDCQACNQLTLFAGKWNDPRAPVYPSQGCTRVDHCESVSVLEQPISAIPAAYLNELNILLDVKSKASTGSDIDGAIRALRKRTNVIVIDKPRHLTKVLFVDMPGTAVPFSMSVMDIYEAMTATFGLPSMDEQVRKARAADPELRPSKHGGMYASDGAGEFDRIRSTLSNNKVMFIPMVIVARVDQTTFNSIGMKLSKPPKE